MPPPNPMKPKTPPQSPKFSKTDKRPGAGTDRRRKDMAKRRPRPAQGSGY